MLQLAETVAVLCPPKAGAGGRELVGKEGEVLRGRPHGGPGGRAGDVVVAGGVVIEGDFGRRTAAEESPRSCSDDSPGRDGDILG